MTWDLPPDVWHVSSYSANNAHCVEVALSADAVGVRDTKDRRGGTLVLAPESWSAFVGRVKDGGCDRV
ncbi:DUF397 domain-containing protein [Actinopolyspora halophila]|uniref:DUF397 domain-containing protein n=1 Tax=Actinopolyspora halophila TaxID=1850 RepID=UPI000375DB8E|nr:DUF397 domain-containing protein [Actinopolyspora halophila]